MSEFPNQFEPTEVEPRLYQFWEKEQIFKADPASPKEPYVIVLPPPNVTGVLHMGHALTCTLEDILIRRKRMQGYNALWLPGTDHAGIATQMVVERHLQKTEKKSRHDLGREKFLEKVWEWKEQSQTTILGQLRLMGCSLDWTRLTFTLDEGVSLAVRETFTRLYNEKLLYKDTSLIQWCPRCHTALSDLEVKAKESKGKLWQIKYRLKNDPNKVLVVATTRPETLLGDTAVAVNPDDDRFKAFVGQEVMVPLTNRAVPVIADSYVDMAFGTGALKITPGHDMNDYQVAKRHNLPILSIFDESAKLNQEGGKYQGLTREKAREQMLLDLAEQGLLGEEKDHLNNVGHCDRCDAILEPRLSQQWFVDAATLAKPAIEAVRNGEIKILPKEWEKTYFLWMENIRPWCVSRQLWWGHRIPAWYCPDGHVTVAVETPKACGTCQSASLKQDEDVLDTWFSSGLWPFSTLGWPKETADMKAFYPNQVMETGFDILFFWVARMIMLGIKMVGKSPFHTVYLHPMVRDEHGQKMSKTKGNVKDPLEIVNKVGADPLRFTLAAMAVHGRDVLLSDTRIEGYRNFVNKIWNATRFVMMHFGDVKEAKSDMGNDVNQWIWTRLETCKKDINLALDQYRFFDAANRIYSFVWNDYCDWYIELIKTENEMSARKAAKDSTAIEVLEEALRLLHPFMPFVTEELWQRMPIKAQGRSISLAPYPTDDPEKLAGRDFDGLSVRRASQEMGRGEFQAGSDRITTGTTVVEAIRSRRGECGLNPNSEIRVQIVGPKKNLDALQGADWVKRLIRASSFTLGGDKPDPKKNVLIAIGEMEAFVPREDLMDVKVEIAKTEKELAGLIGELERAKQKLTSHEFVGRAPENVIKGVQDRKTLLEKQVETLQAHLKNLKEG